MPVRKSSCSAGKMLFNVRLEIIVNVMNFLNGGKRGTMKMGQQ
jgi:hypothetical protein